MDTSDSEYFESADEELYPENDEISKFPKKRIETNDLNVVQGLINLSITENEKKLDPANEQLELNVNNLSNKKFDESAEVKDSSKKNIEETLQKSIESPKSVESQQQVVQDNIFTKVIKNDKVKAENDNLSSSEESKSELSQSKENTIVGKQLERIENNSIDSEITDISAKKFDEENMWDNDGDWEPIVDKMEPVVSVKKSEDYKPVESKHNDIVWDDSDWEPVLDSKFVDEGSKHKESKNKDDNMWDNDDWEPFEKIESDKSFPSNQKQPETSWSGWGNWGVTTILTTASQGVSTLTNQVSQGISTVLETGIGIPDPKELAIQDKINENLEGSSEFDKNKPNLSFGFGNLSNLVSGVSHITKFVENTGNKVISGGLDTLETIGKKTMEVLQEGDPGLKNKRALLKLDKDKPILSQVLREAKERSERDNKVLQEVHAKKKLNYETLFDDYHGLVHLEALEMLSKQCDIKLQTLSDNCTGNELQDLQETMDQIKELCELPDEDDDEVPTFEDMKEKVQTAVKDINVSITYEKLISTWQDTENWLNNLKLDFCDEVEIHQEALQVLAQLTAIAVEQFHKCGELLLIKEHRSTADEADSLVQLTMAVTSLIGLVAAKFSDKLNTKSLQTGNKDSINELITNVFFEAGNSSSYIQDAFQLLVPVLQVGAV